jgi:hypothetical protein
VGKYTSLALDGDDHFYISYYDDTEDDLKLAYQAGATLVIEWVDTSGDVGSYTSLALDGADNPHISYYDSDTDDLKYAYWTGDAWARETVDGGGNVGQHTSIALDGDDNPHISYYDGSNSALKYAQWITSSNSWVSETVDSGGSVGAYTSLALDGDGNPRISYYDGYPNYDLKYAYWRTLPSVDFSSAVYGVGEGVGSAVITATLGAVSAQTVTVDFATGGGTATAGSDYAAASGTLTFGPGITSRTFSVSITQDERDEHDETVTLTLSGATNAVIGSNNPAVLTIGDDDDPPLVDFGSAAYRVNEDAGAANILVTLDVPSGLTVTVEYATADGTATAGEDYAAVSGTLTFTPGVSSRAFVVPIMGDEIEEGEETVTLTLSNAGNAAIGGNNPAVLTIAEEVEVYLPLVLKDE